MLVGFALSLENEVLCSINAVGLRQWLDGGFAKFVKPPPHIRSEIMKPDDRIVGMIDLALEPGTDTMEQVFDRPRWKRSEESIQCLPMRAAPRDFQGIPSLITKSDLLKNGIVSWVRQWAISFRFFLRSGLASGN